MLILLNFGSSLCQWVPQRQHNNLQFKFYHAGVWESNENPGEAFRRHGVAFFRDPNGIRIDVMLADTVFDETVIGRATEITLSSGKTICIARLKTSLS